MATCMNTQISYEIIRACYKLFKENNYINSEVKAILTSATRNQELPSIFININDINLKADKNQNLIKLYSACMSISLVHKKEYDYKKILEITSNIKELITYNNILKKSINNNNIKLSDYLISLQSDSMKHQQGQDTNSFKLDLTYKLLIKQI